MNITIGFFGTPLLAANVLRDLLTEEGIHVRFVVTNTDTASGRSSVLRPTPVKLLAQEYDLPVFTPEKIRNNMDFLSTVTNYHVDYFIVVAYGKIFPIELLMLPKKKCINVHGSLLPKYRGASPIQGALLGGETKTGVSIMEMSEGMDEGDIILTETISIDPRETSGSLFEKFASISGPTLIHALEQIEAGNRSVTPQNHQETSYTRKIVKEDGRVRWCEDAISLFRKWQAFTPVPGLYTFFEQKRLLIEDVDYSDEPPPSFPPGTVFQDDHEVGIVCGKGWIILHRVKLEGKRSQEILDFCNGQRSFIGKRLE